MTYRERRERKAERLRGWAEKRQQEAGAVIENIDRQYSGDVAFNTQPGHIPERARVIARQDRAFDSLHKAEGMVSRAGNIEAQLDGAIYSDDPDAVERLEERLADLEAQRERIKTANAAYRKEHGAELKGLTAYQREQKMPHAGWELSNLSGNIARQRQRLEELRRKAGLRARAEASPVERCALCGRDVQAISATEYVDERNNKASMWPEWHEHTPAPELEVGPLIGFVGVEEIRAKDSLLGRDHLVTRGVGDGLLGYPAKVAMVRVGDLPVGEPGPLVLSCPCGARPPTTVDGPDVRCSCGVTYSYNGWTRTPYDVRP